MKLELCSPTERDSELGHHLAVRASKNNRQQGIRVSKKNPADCRNFPIAMGLTNPIPRIKHTLRSHGKKSGCSTSLELFRFVFLVTRFLGLTIHIVLKKALSFAGWWFGIFFSPIVGMMIQSDFHIFQGGWYTTNQIYYQPSKTIIINHHH